MLINAPRLRAPSLPTLAASPRWMAAGLVALFDQRNGREVISGARSSANTAGLSATVRGVAADYSGTANQQYAHQAAFAQTGPMTLVVVLDVRSLTNYSAVVAKQSTATTNAPYELRLGAGPTTSEIQLLRAGSGTYTALTTGANRITAPFSGSIIIAAAAGQTQSPTTYWLNGVAYNAGSNSGVAVTDAGASVWIGRRYDGATQLDGRIFMVALFNRALNENEARAIHLDPWQLFAPPTTRIWVPNAATVFDTPVNPGAGALTLTGPAPTVAQTANQSLTPGAGALTVTGPAPTLTQTANQALVPGVGSLTLTGYAPTVTQAVNQSVLPGAGALTVTGPAPTLTQTANQSLTPGAGGLTITGPAPTVTQTGGASLAPGAGALTVAGPAPTVAQTANQSLTPAAGALTLTGYAPTVAQAPAAILTPGAGALTVTGYAPTVTQVSASTALTPPAGALTLTGYAPTVRQTVDTEGKGGATRSNASATQLRARKQREAEAAEEAELMDVIALLGAVGVFECL